MDKEKIIEELDRFLGKNDYSAAREHLLLWLSRAEEAGDEPASLLLLNELMGLCRKLGEKDNAVFYATSALNKVRQMNIEQNVGAATTYLNSATVYKAFGEAEKALPLYERAREIYERSLPENDERLSGLYNNMALALVDLSRFREAEELYIKAIKILKFSSGKEPEQAITYLNLASATEAELGLIGGEEKITEYINKARELMNIGAARTDGGYAFVCEKCAPVFGYYGYFLDEQELAARARRIYEGS